jgi:hypothetical protein
LQTLSDLASARAQSARQSEPNTPVEGDDKDLMEVDSARKSGAKLAVL